MAIAEACQQWRHEGRLKSSVKTPIPTEVRASDTDDDSTISLPSWCVEELLEDEPWANDESAEDGGSVTSSSAEESDLEELKNLSGSRDVEDGGFHSSKMPH